MSTLSPIVAAAWQLSWDRQQESYLPDREHRLEAMFAAVEALLPRRPWTLLDLAGGTGSISLRAVRRFADVRTVLVDVDPVLMEIARASLDRRSTIVSANLNTPDWLASVPDKPFDAVLMATASHWIHPTRLTEIYAEVRSLLAPGGVFINTDHMPDETTATINERFVELEEFRRRVAWGSVAAPSWDVWWDAVEADPAFAVLIRERALIFPERHTRKYISSFGWHVEAMRQAGFGEVGPVWRGGRDAALAGVLTRC